MDDQDDRDNQRAPIGAPSRRGAIADNIIPFRKKWNAKAEETRRRLDRDGRLFCGRQECTRKAACHRTWRRHLTNISAARMTLSFRNEPKPPSCRPVCAGVQGAAEVRPKGGVGNRGRVERRGRLVRPIPDDGNVCGSPARRVKRATGPWEPLNHPRITGDATGVVAL
jgi:hypothetical protein